MHQRISVVTAHYDKGNNFVSQTLGAVTIVDKKDCKQKGYR